MERLYRNCSVIELQLNGLEIIFLSGWASTDQAKGIIFSFIILAERLRVNNFDLLRPLAPW